jgi:hypothetical protein
MACRPAKGEDRVIQTAALILKIEDNAISSPFSGVLCECLA